MKVLIKGGLVIDGGGNCGRKVDILLQNGTIVEIGENIQAHSAEKICADGLVVMPGFVDMHSHGDFDIEKCIHKIEQGVTSEVTGNCGFSPFPYGGNSDFLEKAALEFEFAEKHQLKLWKDFESFSKQELMPTNLVPLIGHSAIRFAVMGNAKRRASAKECEKMAELLDTNLLQGAFGLSSGLVYEPGCYSDMDEMKELCHVVAKHNALYTSHIRNEEDGIRSALDEIIQTGKLTGCKVHVSHLKAIGHGKIITGQQLLDIISDARKVGVDISADQYPYNASATILKVLLPDIEKKILLRGGAEKILLPDIGCSLAEIAAQLSINPAQAVEKLIATHDNKISAVFMSMSDEDVEVILKPPYIMVGSDAIYAERPHPRAFGTFARLLGFYVREKKSLSLETAIYKMTHLPCKRLGIYDRGILNCDAVADITMIDAEKIIDNADFLNPSAISDGVEHVLINGQWALRYGKLTGNLCGAVLKRHYAL